MDVEKRFRLLKDFGKFDGLFLLEEFTELYNNVRMAITDCSYCNDSGVNYPVFIPGFNESTYGTISNCKRCGGSNEPKFYLNSETMEVTIV